MEGVIYAVIGFAGVLIGSGFSYLGIKMNLTQQNKIDSHQWRRKVRGKPLFKLRAELARMASKLDKLAASAHQLHTRFAKTEEEAKEELEESRNDWNNYISRDDLRQVLFIQCDKGLLNSVNKIRDEYLQSYENGAIYRKELSAVELGKAARSAKEKIIPKIIEVQELINKRLEKL